MTEASRVRGRQGDRVHRRGSIRVFVNVTGSMHPEAINMPSRGAHAYTRTSLVATVIRDVLLSHKGQGRDNYDARGSQKKRIQTRACNGGRKGTVLLEMRMPLL